MKKIEGIKEIYEYPTKEELEDLNQLEGQEKIERLKDLADKYDKNDTSYLKIDLLDGESFEIEKNEICIEGSVSITTYDGQSIEFYEIDKLIQTINKALMEDINYFLKIEELNHKETIKFMDEYLEVFKVKENFIPIKNIKKISHIHGLIGK